MANLNPMAFLRQVKQEVSKVTWPTRSHAFNMTIVVICMCLLLSLFFLAADWISAGAVRTILGIGA